MIEKQDIIVMRHRRGLTQPGLAKEIGVGVATVWRWENVGVPKDGPAHALLKRMIIETGEQNEVD